MSEELQQKLRSQLWTVANTLRGNMSASDFMLILATTVALAGITFVYSDFLEHALTKTINTAINAKWGNKLFFISFLILV